MKWYDKAPKPRKTGGVHGKQGSARHRKRRQMERELDDYIQWIVTVLPDNIELIVWARDEDEADDEAAIAISEHGLFYSDYEVRPYEADA